MQNYAQGGEYQHLDHIPSSQMLNSEADPMTMEMMQAQEMDEYAFDYQNPFRKKESLGKKKFKKGSQRVSSAKPKTKIAFGSS